MAIAIEIDDESADAIVVAALKQAIKGLEEDLAHLTARESLRSHEVRDYIDIQENLTSLTMAHNYFTPPSEHL